MQRDHQPAARLAWLLIARSKFENLRAPVLGAPVLAAMRTIAAEDPGLKVWDASPILCPDKTCSAMTPDGPLFLDGDHLSGHANEVIYPNLSRSLLAILARLPDSPDRL